MKNTNNHPLSKTINNLVWQPIESHAEIYHNMEDDRFALILDGCIEEEGYLSDVVAVRDAIALADLT
tara:strand:+ start:34 stop:234 length:201 start_codon:yes stop_codon:yes gene_type:complete